MDVTNIEKNINYILKVSRFDVIVSDICIPLSGIRLIDINSNIKLLYNLFYLCKLFLLNNGTFVSKIWNSLECKLFIIYIKNNFKKIYIYKPISSNYKSNEQYMIAKQFKN